jgi:transglutaminase-like putative cysteine protease
VRIPELEAEQTFESTIDLEYSTSALSFRIDEVTPPRGSPESLYEYCRADKFWEIKDPVIRRTADRISSSSQNLEGFLSSTFAWIRDNVRLREPQPTRFGAAKAIRELTGDCDELSDLFIALCRAANVPCRRVVGIFYHGRESESRPFDWHAWAEVHVARDVWVPFDPSLNFFASISERHLARCCMGIESDYSIRRLTWRSHPTKSPVLNDDDVEGIVVVS